MRTFRNIGCIVAMALPMAACSTGRENPQTVFNDFNNLMLAGDGQITAPVDVDPPVPVELLLSDGEAGSTPSAVSQGGEELASEIVLTQELIDQLLPTSGNGKLTSIPGQAGVFRVQCQRFLAADDLFQTRRDLCWIATVRMLESYEDGEARSEEAILADVRGDQAVEYEEGQNYGNVYEIVRALNPKLEKYDQEIAYFTVSALDLDGAQSEELWGYGLLQAQRFMDQFMGAEDMLASLAAGKPVIVGLDRPIPPGQGEGTFGHAMLMYAADFAVITSEQSTELQLYRVENLVDSVVLGRDLWGNLGDLNPDKSNLERLKALGGGVWDGTKRAWRAVTSGDKEIDRPFRLAVHKVYLVDPLGKYRGFTEEVTLTGPEFHEQFQFALTRDKARELVPITDQAELEAVLGVSK